jgi:hypothetical protein
VDDASDNSNATPPCAQLLLVLLLPAPGAVAVVVGELGAQWPPPTAGPLEAALAVVDVPVVVDAEPAGEAATVRESVDPLATTVPAAGFWAITVPAAAALGADADTTVRLAARAVPVACDRFCPTSAGTVTVRTVPIAFRPQVDAADE